jgi:GT2 family glycosyltransferase
MTWTVVSATNDEVLLNSCLLSSPEIGDATDVILQRGYPSAAAAYNAGLQAAKTDLVIFVHQDVYLPKGWVASLRSALDLLSRVDPNWGVLGVWGFNELSEDGLGFLYCVANGKLGSAFAGLREVRTLDEVLLIVRKSSKLNFDERVPGYHMYGTDVCLEARRRGMKSYAIPAFCIHNTSGYRMLPLQFWSAYLFVRKKWRSELPITTSCIRITFSCWPMVRWNIIRAANIALGRHRAGSRVHDPSRLNTDLMSSDKGVTRLEPLP